MPIKAKLSLDACVLPDDKTEYFGWRQHIVVVARIMWDGGSRGSQKDDQRQGVVPCVGPTLHACAFELEAMAAYLVREVFLSFLLASYFCRCNYRSRLQPSQANVSYKAPYLYFCLWVVLGHGNKTLSELWHLFAVSTCWGKGILTGWSRSFTRMSVQNIFVCKNSFEEHCRRSLRALC